MLDVMSEQSFSDAVHRPRRPLASAPRKSEKTRQAILDSALEFLWTQPFRDLTVANLMSAADASRPTFYQYFTDLHDLMGVLLDEVQHDILDAARPWFEGPGDPRTLLDESLSGLVGICYKRGPILRAVSDAAVADELLEKAWAGFMKGFDETVAAQIERQQAAGLVAQFPAHPVAVALNRLDTALLIDQFGRRPRGDRKAVLESLTRIWISTLYGLPESRQPA